MTKSSLPMALSFFLGKRRAKIIIEEEEQRSSDIEDLSIRYKALIYDHLENQIKAIRDKYPKVLNILDKWITVIDKEEQEEPGEVEDEDPVPE